jgi:hypothetical protein
VGCKTKYGYKFFLISGERVDGTAGIQNQETDAMDLEDFSDTWILYANSSHAVGNPTITIQASNDGVDWFNYKDDAVDVALPETIIDGEFLGRFMKVVYTANGSDGNITFSLAQTIEC